MASFQKPKALSIVIPVRNEEDNVANLIAEIRQALQKVGLSPKGGNYERANKLFARMVK